MANYKMEPLLNNVVEMFIGPFGSSLKNDCFVNEKDAYCMVYEQKHAIQKTMNLETRYVNEKKYNELKRFDVRGGDIIVSCRGTIGETYVVPDDAPLGIMHPSIMKIRLKEGVYDKRYFNLLLKSRLKKHELEANGSGVKMAISATELGKELFPVPSMAEQNEISKIISSVTEVIVKRNEELDKLNDLIKARFVEMFGDPKINEKKWKTGVISQFYEVKGGKRIPKGMQYADAVTSHPYLRVTDMKNGTILDDDIHYIDENVFKHIKKYTVKSGDIYLTNVGVNLGMAGVIPNKYDGANLTENAVKLVPKSEGVLDGLFLAYYINSPGIQEYINERKMTVGVPKLAIFRIETMPLLIPPMELQKEFIAFCKQIDKSRFTAQKALDEAQLLFDSLMQKYFG